MPTISHLSRCEMVGSLALCASYGLRTDLLGAQAQSYAAACDRWRDWQIISDFQKLCQARE